MSADSWAYLLIGFGVVGFLAECYAVWKHSKKLFWLISACHGTLCALMVAYSAAALAGVLTYAPWNFGAPALGALLALWHFIYVKRRPHVEIPLDFGASAQR